MDPKFLRVSFQSKPTLNKQLLLTTLTRFPWLPTCIQIESHRLYMTISILFADMFVHEAACFSTSQRLTDET